MSEPIILAVIGGVVTVLTAIVGKLSLDVHHTRRDTRAVHESINNRPTSVSDRLDAIKDSICGIQEDVRTLAENDGELRLATRSLARRVTVLERGD